MRLFGRLPMRSRRERRNCARLCTVAKLRADRKRWAGGLNQ